MGLLNLVISGTNMRDIFVGLDEFQQSLDLRPLAEDIGVVIREDNEAARIAGIGEDGAPLAPLAQVTIDARNGDPNAPPLIPHHGGSRSIEDFSVRISELDDDAVAITGSWPDTPFIHFHQTGYTSRGGNPVPARRIVGVRPEAEERIAAIFRAWAESKVDGA